MRKYIGSIDGFVQNPENETDEPLWVDYQVLGPMFSALRIFMTMDDVMTVIVGAKGCAYHLNFTIIAWGEIDFDLGKRPLPVLEFTQSQLVMGNLTAGAPWLDKLKRLCALRNSRRIVLFPTDAVTISGADLDRLSTQIASSTSLEVTPLSISAISSPNQWAGYDAALNALYAPYFGKTFEREKAVNLVGWMWPSRHRSHEIGCCMAMLKELNIPVQSVISGGSTLQDIENSMSASANAVVCSAVMGTVLQRLDSEGIKLAGPRAPYGFSGTREWLESISDALDMDVKAGIDAMESRYMPAFLQNKEQLKGKKVFVGGGPGRIIGLLHALNDYEMDIQVACMFWPHEWSRQDVSHLLKQHHLKVGTFILSPGLDDLEWAAENHDFDVWMGGYQELHTCKRHHIPFVPITVYTVTHVGFEGCVNLGNKMLMAMNGHNFVENNFTANEIEGYQCKPCD